MKIFGLTISREATPSTNGSTKTGTSQNEAYLANVVRAGSVDRSMQIAAVYRCVNMISDGIAVMPLHYKRWNASQKVYVPFAENDRNYYEYMLNIQPNSRMNGFVFKKQIVMQMLLRGNAIVVPLRNSSGYAYRLLLVSADASVQYDDVRNEYHIYDLRNGLNGIYAASDVWHFKNPGSNGLWGESTISYARRTMDIAATSESETLKRFATGGKIKAIVSGVGNAASFGQHNTEQLTKATEELEEHFSTHDFSALPDKDLKVTPLSMNNADLQFIESRKFTLADIARWFGVPLLKLGDGSNSNYKTVDAAQVNFYTEALQPICTQIETEILSKCTTFADWDWVKFDFDETPLFSMDLATRMQVAKQQLDTGMATVNELRRKNDIEPIEGGDTLLMSANTKSIDTLIDETK